jgi:hypothetical protein
MKPSEQQTNKHLRPTDTILSTDWNTQVKTTSTTVLCCASYPRSYQSILPTYMILSYLAFSHYVLPHFNFCLQNLFLKQITRLVVMVCASNLTDKLMYSMIFYRIYPITPYIHCCSYKGLFKWIRHCWANSKYTIQQFLNVTNFFFTNSLNKHRLSIWINLMIFSKRLEEKRQLGQYCWDRFNGP